MTNLKPSQVAALYGCDPKTPLRWLASGKLAGFKGPGGHWLVPVENVVAALVAGGASVEQAEAMVAGVARRQVGS